jgi:hypothetical protein
MKGRIDIGDVMQVCFRQFFLVSFRPKFPKDRNSLGKRDASPSQACREGIIHLPHSPRHPGVGFDGGDERVHVQDALDESPST